LVSFGPPAWDAYQANAITDRALQRQIDCPPEGVGEQECGSIVAGGTSRTLAIQAAHTQVQRQRDRGLVVSAAGLLLALVGLARGRVRPGPRGWLPGTLLGLWAFAENLVLALFCLLLGGYAYLLVGRLAAGGPFTWAVADQTARRVFAVIFDVAQGE
jgi:hypothetical protein